MTEFELFETPPKKQKPWLILILLLLVAVLSGSLLYFYTYHQQKIVEAEHKLRVTIAGFATTPPLTQADKAQRFREEELKYFITEIYPNHPTLTKEISDPTAITSVVLLGLDRIILTNNSRVYMVRHEDFVNLDISPETLPCDLKSLDVVRRYSKGNGTETTLPTKSFAISGTCYSFFGQSFVGLYDESTGERIPLKNPQNVRIPHVQVQYLTFGDGFAGGRLYEETDVDNPIIIVHYEHSGFAVFSTKTGLLLDSLFFGNF